jgi:hypothetical protein
MTSKSGLKLALEISGTQEEPVVMLSPVAGKPTVKGPCHIAASQKRTQAGVPAIADSIFVENAKGFIQLDVAPIRAAIAALPRKIYYARIVTEIIDLDGDKCPVTRWVFESGMTSPKTGASIGTSTMAAFLNSKKISEIEISKACQMWADEMETEEFIAARKITDEKRAIESKKFAQINQHWSDMEEMENGQPLPEERDPTSMYPREG